MDDSDVSTLSEGKGVRKRQKKENMRYCYKDSSTCPQNTEQFFTLH